MSSEIQFGYNSGAARYVDLNTGQFLSGDFLIEVLDDRIDEAFDRLASMAAGLANGTVSVPEWQQAVLVELRRAHTQAAALGRGGWNQMTPSDWGRVGRQLRFEYERLAGFAQLVASGQMSLAQLQARLDMYADHVWTSYWAGKTEAAREAGAVSESRHREARESCDDCKGYEAQGEVPIGTLPEPGQNSKCKARCKCRKQYYDANGNQIG